MTDLFSGMDQPHPSDPPGAGQPRLPDPTGAVEGLRCAESGCSGRLAVRWSHQYETWFYGCSEYPGCRGTLPADKVGAPKGKPRTKAVQAARAAAHAAFDTIWKEGLCSRGAAYSWLRRAMVLTPDKAHMYRMDEEQCAKVIRLVEEKGPGTEFWASWYRPEKRRR